VLAHYQIDSGVYFNNRTDSSNRNYSKIANKSHKNEYRKGYQKGDNKSIVTIQVLLSFINNHSKRLFV
jgi:hypothetical protein